MLITATQQAINTPMMKSADNQSPVPVLDKGSLGQRVTTFIADDQSVHAVVGNPCDLIIAEPPSSKNIQPDLSAVTRCFSWSLAGQSSAEVSVQCYAANGQGIRYCGHGLLAASYYWQQRWQCQRLTLLMSQQRIPSWQEADITWLRFSTLSSQRCAIPRWVSSVFAEPQLPIAAAISGDDSDYLILQWPDDADLTKLQPQLQRLSSWTKRALIITAAQPANDNINIQLRYFAPQYGVDEDIATGSAMRVLAHFWSQRFDQLTAYQCSTSGGYLLSRFKGDTVEVGGRCQIQ